MCSITHVNGVLWSNLAIDGINSVIKQGTGYEPGVLDDIYLRYHTCMFPASTGRYPSWSDCTWDQIHYYLLWTYIHLYPKFDNFKRVMRVKGQGDGIGVKAFRDSTIPSAFRLAQAIDELNWDAPMGPRNHHVLFPTIFTGIFDTFPITISCPLSSQAQYLFFAKKYEACVVKVQMACTFLRDIILFSGPHAGAECDSTLGVSHIDTLDFEPNEICLGDGIYYLCSRLIVPNRKPQNGCLTRHQIIENDLFAEARSAIEQVNALIVHRFAFEGRNFRGDTSLLGVFLKITIHATALYIRMGYARLPGF